VLAHLFRATPQRSRRAGNSRENQSDRSDGRQLENHTHRDHRRYETRNADATNSIRQLCVATDPLLERVDEDVQGRRLLEKVWHASERSDRDAMADVHDAVVEPALVKQLELGAQFAR
jgi:hypothetical protein